MQERGFHSPIYSDAVKRLIGKLLVPEEDLYCMKMDVFCADIVVLLDTRGSRIKIFI